MAVAAELQSARQQMKMSGCLAAVAKLQSTRQQMKSEQRAAAVAQLQGARGLSIPWLTVPAGGLGQLAAGRIEYSGGPL